MSPDRKFIRTEEDFLCEVCGEAVQGNGYTNHCPQCLASKHVDVHPGDRAESCNGIMEAVEVEIRSGRYTITHKCQSCGSLRKVKSAKNDRIERLIEVAAARASKLLPNT